MLGWPPPARPSEAPLPVLIGPVPRGLEPTKGVKPPTSYAEIVLKDGRVFRSCEVIRSEPDALHVKHQGGVARLSFFDLPESIQREHGFDPVVAMRHARAEMDRQRDLKWKLFWERQNYESEQARQAEYEAIAREAAREWVPVEATILRRLGPDAVLASCRRITFEKTTTKSTLGFTVDGPPRRVLVDFGDGPLALRFAVPPGDVPAGGGVWKVFVHPVSDGEISFEVSGSTAKAGAHRVVPAK